MGDVRRYAEGALVELPYPTNEMMSRSIRRGSISYGGCTDPDSHRVGGNTRIAAPTLRTVTRYGRLVQAPPTAGLPDAIRRPYPPSRQTRHA